MKRRILVLTSLLAVFAASASATPISIISGGTFSASTPSSSFSGPSQPWSFAFVADSNPVVSNVGLGQGFDATFSNFSYDLNGSPVAITPANIRFFSNPPNQGMLLICFSTTTCDQTTGGGLSFVGPQMYSGSESAPTILTGDLTSTRFVVFFGRALYDQANGIVQAANVPEPMTLSLMGAGLLGLGFLRRYRKI